jgi:hypothetical protein
MGGACELLPEPPASLVLPEDALPVPEDPPPEGVLVPHATAVLTRIDPATHVPKKLIRIVSSLSCHWAAT